MVSWLVQETQIWVAVFSARRANDGIPVQSAAAETMRNDPQDDPVEKAQLDVGYVPTIVTILMGVIWGFNGISHYIMD